MGLLINYSGCKVCMNETVCKDLEHYLKKTDVSFSVEGEGEGKIMIYDDERDPWILDTCPFCKKKTRVWHENGHWHITERE